MCSFFCSFCFVFSFLWPRRIRSTGRPRCSHVAHRNTNSEQGDQQCIERWATGSKRKRDHGAIRRRSRRSRRLRIRLRTRRIRSRSPLSALAHAHPLRQPCRCHCRTRRIIIRTHRRRCRRRFAFAAVFAGPDVALPAGARAPTRHRAANGDPSNGTPRAGEQKNCAVGGKERTMLRRMAGGLLRSRPHNALFFCFFFSVPLSVRRPFPTW